MHLTRCQDQKHRSLEEYFGTAIHPEDPRPYEYDDEGAMISLIQRLRALPNERQVYGRTSGRDLCLLSQDTPSAPCFVKVTAVSKRMSMYFIEYLMPAQNAPWPQAYITGEASSEDKAVEMIVIGMDKSGGWSSSP